MNTLKTARTSCCGVGHEYRTGKKRGIGVWLDVQRIYTLRFPRVHAFSYDAACSLRRSRTFFCLGLRTDSLPDDPVSTQHFPIHRSFGGGELLWRPFPCTGTWLREAPPAVVLPSHREAPGLFWTNRRQQFPAIKCGIRHTVSLLAGASRLAASSEFVQVGLLMLENVYCVYLPPQWTFSRSFDILGSGAVTGEHTSAEHPWSPSLTYVFCLRSTRGVFFWVTADANSAVASCQHLILM